MKRRSVGLETLLKQALRDLKRGRYERALRRLAQLLPRAENDPTLTEQVHLAMADASLSLRHLPEAIKQAKMAIALNPEGDRAYYLLGFAHSVGEAWDQAVPALRQALALDPDEAEYYRSLGWALFNQDQTRQEGLDMLEQALKIAPAHISTLTDLAMVHGQEHRFDQALVFARRAAELAPSDPRTQDILESITHFKREFERLGEQPAPKPPPEPETEAEWRALIAATDDYNEVMQRWVDLHPAQTIEALNSSLREFNDLWNSTPRPELGGRSPNQMRGRADD